MPISAFLGSIWLTIPLLILTAIFVAIATFLEGSSGSHKLAEGWIYHNPLFTLLLSLYFVNILFSSLRRYPFKKHHIPFLITHLGLLMVILGVALKGIFGLQGIMRVHEGEGSHTVILPHLQGLFGQNGKWRFSFPVKEGETFFESDILFTPLEIFPHGEKEWEGWIRSGRLSVKELPDFGMIPFEKGQIPTKNSFGDRFFSVLETEEPIETFIPWKETNNWWLFLKNREGKITIGSIDPSGGVSKKIFDPKSPGQMMVFDGGRGGYAAEMDPFTTSLTLKVTPLSSPSKLEEAMPLLKLRAEKGEETIEMLLPYERNGGGLFQPFFETLLKFQPVVAKIPNHLHLHQAKTFYRPGTTLPESYEAKVAIDSTPFTLKMNQVFESNEGYRFYLSNIYGEPGEVKEVHLAVNYDPTKYILTYPGGGLVVIGSLLLLFRRRKL